MICYIKSFKDFKTIAKYDAVTYSLADGEDGRVTIYEKDPVQLVTKYVGCWLVIGDGKVNAESLQYSYSTEVDEEGGIVLNITGGNLNVYENPLVTGGIEYNINAKRYTRRQYVFYISGCSPEDDSLDLTIRHPIYAFERAVLYDGSEDYGTLISNILNNDYGVNCTDPEFKIDYMDVTNSDHTECIVETNNYGYIVPCDIFEDARKNGVIIDFINTPTNRLSVEIKTAAYEKGIVVFGDGHSIIQSESYDASYCSKVTVLHELQKQSDVLLSSEKQIVTADNLKIAVQFSQDIAKSRQTGKTVMMARLYAEWEKLKDGNITFNKNRFDVYLGTNTSGTKILKSAPEWKRTEDAGYMYTDWFELKGIDETESVTVYVICNANGSSEKQPGGQSFYLTMTIEGLIKSTDIKIGPLMNDGDEDSRTLYRILEYYLTKDGQIVQEQPEVEDRANGQWQIYEANSSDSPLMVATGAFSNNSDNHKIEFYSDTYFEYYQPMKLRLRNEVLDTIITSRTVTRTDERYFYKCGNLVTTLTDHVQKAEAGDDKNDKDIVKITSDVEKLKTQGQQTSKKYTKSVDDPEPRSTITIGSGGYVEIAPPDSLPDGAVLQGVSIIYWGSNTGAFDIKPYGQDGRRAFVIGTPNTTIMDLQCRWWYS